MKKVLATPRRRRAARRARAGDHGARGCHAGQEQREQGGACPVRIAKGRNEIRPDGQRGASDPDGRGGFTALIANNQVCFGLTVDNIATPVAAHIHRGKPSENRPIVVTFAPLPGSGDPGASGGCVPPDGGNSAVLEEILKHPNHFYANVHTGAFPGGAVRGQLKHRRP
jgi:hypothetical protein